MTKIRVLELDRVSWRWVPVLLLLGVLCTASQTFAADHSILNETVKVRARDQSYFFARRQGISIRVSPRRKWWCLWLCTTTTKVEEIDSGAVLTGLAPTETVHGSCTNCGRKNVMGPWFWGWNVPQSFDQVAYKGHIKKQGAFGNFNGIEPF